MAGHAADTVIVNARKAYRVIALCLLNDSYSDSVTKVVEGYVRPSFPGHWATTDKAAETLPASHSQFLLNEPSMFSDGSFPIGYFCEKPEGALDEFGERIIDLIILGAGNGVASMEVAIIEVEVSGRFIDISGDKEKDHLDPMEDWQDFGKLARSDKDIDGVMFSGSVYEEDDPIWYAAFAVDAIILSDEPNAIYQLKWDQGEFLGYTETTSL
jgi:hypothetical protein